MSAGETGAVPRKFGTLISFTGLVVIVVLMTYFTGALGQVLVTGAEFFWDVNDDGYASRYGQEVRTLSYSIALRARPLGYGVESIPVSLLFAIALPLLARFLPRHAGRPTSGAVLLLWAFSAVVWLWLIGTAVLRHFSEATPLLLLGVCAVVGGLAALPALLVGRGYVRDESDSRRTARSAGFILIASAAGVLAATLSHVSAQLIRNDLGPPFAAPFDPSLAFKLATVLELWALLPLCGLLVLMGWMARRWAWPTVPTVLLLAAISIAGYTAVLSIGMELRYSGYLPEVFEAIQALARGAGVLIGGAVAWLALERVAERSAVAALRLWSARLRSRPRLPRQERHDANQRRLFEAPGDWEP